MEAAPEKEHEELALGRRLRLELAQPGLPRHLHYCRRHRHAWHCCLVPRGRPATARAGHDPAELRPSTAYASPPALRTDRAPQRTPGAHAPHGARRMVTVEAVETSVFLRGLVGSFPELWHRACNEAMVVLVPQVASLESERISLQSAGESVRGAPWDPPRSLRLVAAASSPPRCCDRHRQHRRAARAQTHGRTPLLHLPPSRAPLPRARTQRITCCRGPRLRGSTSQSPASA